MILKSSSLEKTTKSRVRRIPQRGIYDRDVVNNIVDSMPICHVGFIMDGDPVVIPMAHWRDGEFIYLHGVAKGRIAACCTNSPISISIARFDGFVLARSAYNHSMNYQSVVIHGTAEVVEGTEERVNQLRNFVEQHFPGRWDKLRPMKAEELHETVILRVPIQVASAKIRTGPPGDENDDPEWKVWTGLVCPDQNAYNIIKDPAMEEGIDEPGYITSFVSRSSGVEPND